MSKLPDEIYIGAKKFNIEYLECIPDQPEAGSWFDVNSDSIYIRNTSALGIQQRHLILRLVGAIARLLSRDARLVASEFPFGHTLFGILAMNPALTWPDSIDDLSEVTIPGHNLKVVSGTLGGENEGELDLNNLEIRVSAALEGYNRFETVWHEITHIVGILIDVPYKEWQVSFLSFCLANMFAQNDFSWLYDDAD